MKKSILLIATLLIVAIGLYLVDYSSVLNSIKGIEIHILIFACLLQIFTIILINVQWKLLGNLIGLRMSFKALFHVNMVGTFVESITPSVKAGGEVSKVYVLNSKLGVPVSKGSALVGFQKTISLLAFLSLNIIGALWFFVRYRQVVNLGILLIGLLFLTLINLIFISSMLWPDTLVGIVCKLPFLSSRKEKINQGLLNFNKTVKDGLKDKKVFALHFILALFIWFFYAVKAYFIAFAMGIQIGFIPLAVVTYLTYMIAMIPVMPGGLGTFEGSFVLLLAPMSIPFDRGLALALVLRFVTFWFVFIISGLYLGLNYLYSLLPMKTNKTPT